MNAKGKAQEYEYEYYERHLGPSRASAHFPRIRFAIFHKNARLFNIFEKYITILASAPRLLKRLASAWSSYANRTMKCANRAGHAHFCGHSTVGLERLRVFERGILRACTGKYRATESGYIKYIC